MSQNDSFASGRSFLKNMASFSIATWIGAALSFCVTPIVTRSFSTVELGKINVFFIVASLLEYIALFGMNQAFLRFYNEPVGKLRSDGLFRVCLGVSIAVTLVLEVVMLVFHNQLSYYIVGGLGLLIPLELCVYLFARVFLTMSNCAYRMKLDVKMFTLQAIFMNVSQKVAYALAGWTDGTANTAIMYACLTTSILLVIFVVLQRKVLYIKKSEIKFTEIRDIRCLVRYAVPLIPALFLAYLNTSLPNLLLKKHIDYAAVGVFSVAVTLVQTITLIQTGFNVFWTPFVYGNYKTNKKQIQKVHNIISMIMPLAGIFIFAFIEVLYLIIGENYRDSQPYFGFMLISPILYTIAETTGLGINIYKKTYLSLLVTGATVVTNYIACIVLIPKLGCLGAALSIGVSSIVMMLTKTLFGETYYDVITNYRKTFGGVLVYCLAATFNYFSYQGACSILIRSVVYLILILIIVLLYLKEAIYLVKVSKSFFVKNN